MYKSKDTKVLDQLVNRYRMFEKCTDIMGIPHIALYEYEVRMTKWDDEPKDFTLSAEKKYMTYIYDQIEVGHRKTSKVHSQGQGIDPV